jgi:prenylcysteine oxidase/farnesylcysteine lyase
MTVDVFGDPSMPVELGASIFVEVNRNLMEAARKSGLRVADAGRQLLNEAKYGLGVWDGSRFVFLQENGRFRWWNILRLIWRYGWSPLRTRSLMKSTMAKFLKMYKWPYFPWKSLSSVTMSSGLIEATWATGSEFLKANSISESFSREIIQASTRVNYGQNLPLIHGLETMVCMATGGAVSVEGGNWQIFHGMLNASQASVMLDSAVTHIRRDDDDDSYILSHFTQNNSTVHSVFDEVIIATPLQFSDIEISTDLEHLPDTVPYVDLYVTIFASPHKLSPLFFGLPAGFPVPETVLTTLPAGVDLGARRKGVGPSGFWSISTLRKATPPEDYRVDVAPGTHYVYKIFSPESLTPSFLLRLLGVDERKVYGSATSDEVTQTIANLPKMHISWSHEKIWHSYPYLYPRATFEEIKLGPHLWYTSGIESFISTMETSSLSGMNAAALILSEWVTQFELQLKMRDE